jgi:hypothetical protein
MQSNTVSHETPTEIAILARVLGNDQGRLSLTMARHLLDTGFTADDKRRMHDLAIRNQDDDLSLPEKEELHAYAKAGTLLSILKAKARRTLRVKPKKRTTN